MDYSAAGPSEHLGLCTLFEKALSFDMVDVSQLALCEVAARRIQMIHDRWKNKMPTLGQSSEEDFHLLLGSSPTRNNIGMAPALIKWMGEELGKEAATSKERRKAREERALAAVPKK